MKTKKQAAEITRLLEQAYPIAECTLDTSNAWQLLVSVRLAAQCTDARVNMITPILFAKYPTINALSDAPLEDITEIVKPCGLGNSKARDIKRCMTMLRDKHNGGAFKITRCRQKKRQPYFRRYLRPACRGCGHSLHKNFQPIGIYEKERQKQQRPGSCGNAAEKSFAYG